MSFHSPIDVSASIAEHGFAVVEAAFYGDGFLRQSAWDNLVDDWNHLRVDEYMADGGKYRLRRFGRFLFRPSDAFLQPLPHSAVFQNRSVNGFAGGIYRNFAPLRVITFQNDCLRQLVLLDFGRFNVLDAARLSSSWEVWVHQIRIQPGRKQYAKPAPEGIHHDGHDFIAMHLIKRHNICGGESAIYDNLGNCIYSCELTDPLDTVYADDHRVMHAVDPICARDQRFVAYRDILIIDYDYKPNLFDFK